jgi:hypothetical protein
MSKFTMRSQIVSSMYGVNFERRLSDNILYAVGSGGTLP